MSKDCSHHVEDIGNLVDIPLNGGKACNGTERFQEKLHFVVGFSSGYVILRQYFDSFGNRVFSILI